MTHELPILTDEFGNRWYVDKALGQIRMVDDPFEFLTFAECEELMDPDFCQDLWDIIDDGFNMIN